MVFKTLCIPGLQQHRLHVQHLGQCLRVCQLVGGALPSGGSAVRTVLPQGGAPLRGVHCQELQPPAGLFGWPGQAEAHAQAHNHYVHDDHHHHNHGGTHRATNHHRDPFKPGRSVQAAFKFVKLMPSKVYNFLKKKLSN